MGSVPCHDVVCAEQSHGVLELSQIELAVSICKKDVFELGSLQPGTYRGSVTAVPFVGHGLQLRHNLLQPRKHTGCTIGASVVYDDDLELRSKNASHLGRLVDHIGDVAFFVETGHDDGKMHGKRA
jgi:hypothetical protein